MSKLFIYLVWMLCATGCSDVLVGSFSHDGETDADTGHGGTDLDSATDTAKDTVTVEDDSDSTPGDDAGDEDSDTDTDAVTVSASLAHRWRFDGNLNDEVGARDAEIVDPIDDVVGNVFLTGREAYLEGGPPTEAQWVSLGTGLLTEQGGGAVSIELFATQWSVNYFSRIFELGGSSREYLLMTWSYENDADSNLVRWWDETQVSVRETDAPYELGREYHIVMTVDPDGGTDGAMRVTWYTALSDAAKIGPAAGSLETKDPLNDLQDINCWLGKSHELTDPVANASYNDVRIWAGALTEEDIALLHRRGPDM